VNAGKLTKSPFRKKAGGMRAGEVDPKIVQRLLGGAFVDVMIVGRKDHEVSRAENPIPLGKNCGEGALYHIKQIEILSARGVVRRKWEGEKGISRAVDDERCLLRATAAKIQAVGSSIGKGMISKAHRNLRKQ
jgi:hypothetical protein